MASLICGSVAYDTIMGFGGQFADQILPDQLHILNVSFLVPSMRRDFGGCAGNIAYALKQLGGEPVPLAAIGDDGEPYLAHLRAQGITTQGVRAVPGTFTAQAMIMTDRDNNQITAFHPGAMQHAHEQVVPELPGLRVAILAPDGREATLTHAEQLQAHGVPFVFDPGQGLPMFDGPTLDGLVAKADWITVNDYEARMLCDRLQTNEAELSRRVRGLVVTLGAQGCTVWEAGQATSVPGVVADAVVDPTGCGDAWRGAFLHGLEQGWSLVRCAELGNRIGALKVAVQGPQNYTVDAQMLATWLA
ncbi:carbohydrate kinase family protein [Comamonas serinivorans]|uniref:Carbohydrate kinase family protein n=1 Tax=Comamonas serinivorans TaxID=1082851 RepID=A0A1Y0EQJ1_9BURK|nr:carbohydrate kinase family protein [Comamonas serinivorans]ARU05927.1 carbohydrate kinase family protein [Comamonas serinivorans]